MFLHEVDQGTPSPPSPSELVQHHDIRMVGSAVEDDFFCMFGTKPFFRGYELSGTLGRAVQ